MSKPNPIKVPGGDSMSPGDPDQGPGRGQDTVVDLPRVARGVRTAQPTSSRVPGWVGRSWPTVPGVLGRRGHHCNSDWGPGRGWDVAADPDRGLWWVWDVTADPFQGSRR